MCDLKLPLHFSGGGGVGEFGLVWFSGRVYFIVHASLEFSI